MLKNRYRERKNTYICIYYFIYNLCKIYFFKKNDKSFSLLALLKGEKNSLFFLVTPCGLRGLSSPIRDQVCLLQMEHGVLTTGQPRSPIFRLLLRAYGKG